MSWLSKGLKKLEKNVTRPIGKAAKKVAPVALPILGTMIPGVGNVAGAALGGAIAGATKHGGNALTNALGGAATGAAIGGVGGALANGVKTVASQGLKAGLKSVGSSALGALGGGNAAGAAGAATKMGTLGKIFNGPLGPAIIEAGGSILSGIGQGRQASADRGESRRQFDLEYGLRKHDADISDEDRQRKLRALEGTAPLRGELMQMLAQRLGVNPAIFQAPTQAPAPVSVGGSQVPHPQAPTQVPPRPGFGQMQGAMQNPEQMQAVLQRLRQVF